MTDSYLASRHAELETSRKTFRLCDYRTIMLDQAAELRNLVSQAARDESPTGGPAVAAGRLFGWQGRSWRQHAGHQYRHRLGRPRPARRAGRRRPVPSRHRAVCNLPERGHVGDILSARRDIHEVLERGPGGILVVPGVWAPDHEIPFSQHAQHRFVEQIQSLGSACGHGVDGCGQRIGRRRCTGSGSPPTKSSW